MPSEPRTATVTDLQQEGIIVVEDGNHGEYRPLAHEFVSEGTPFVRPDDLKGGRVKFATCDRINEEALNRVRKGRGRAGDIVFTHRATVGRIARIGPSDPDFVANPGVTVWRSTAPAVLDPGYLYFFMQTPTFMNQVWAQAGSTDTFPYVSLTQQRSLEVTFPGIEVQRAIADILGALDDKIELNRRMAETLEAMARTLFKSWFVDFDPVRAKAKGRSTELPDDLAALFPSTLGNDDELPEGWSREALTNLATRDRATVDPADLGGATVQHFSLPAFDSGRRPVREPASDIKSLKVSLSPPVVLISKLNPDIPRVWPVLSKQGAYLLASTEFIALQPKPEGPPLSYVASLLQSLSFQTKATSMVTGTSKSHQRVQPEALLQTRWPVPTRGLLEIFDGIVAPMMARVEALIETSETLGTLRDTVLPRLISGELRIRDAESAIEAA